MTYLAVHPVQGVSTQHAQDACAFWCDESGEVHKQGHAASFALRLALLVA